MTDPSDYLSIGDFSLYTRLTPKALHYYEEKGLFITAKKEITGYRMYTYPQINQGLLLKRLAILGFGLQEMRTVLDVVTGKEDRTALDVMISTRVADIDAKIRELEKVKGELEGKTFEEMIEMDYEEPKIKSIPAMRVVSRRDKGRYEEVIPRLIQEICTTMLQQTQGGHMCGPPMVLYHDGEHKEEDADVEVAIPITGRVTVDPRFEIKTWEPHRAVSLIHKGRYPLIGQAWGHMGKYLVENGIRCSAPCRELYLNDPCNTPEDDLLTELQSPME